MILRVFVVLLVKSECRNSAHRSLHVRVFRGLECDLSKAVVYHRDEHASWLNNIFRLYPQKTFRSLMLPVTTLTNTNKTNVVDLTRSPLKNPSSRKQRTVSLTRGQIRVRLQEDIETTPSLRPRLTRNKTAKL